MATRVQIYLFIVEYWVCILGLVGERVVAPCPQHAKMRLACQAEFFAVCFVRCDRDSKSPRGGSRAGLGSGWGNYGAQE